MLNNDEFFTVLDPENSRSLTPSSPYRKKPEPKKKRTPETKLQTKIIKWLEEHGAIVLRTNSGVFTGASGNRVQGGWAGVSDLNVCWRGKFVAIEIKVEGRQLTKMQQKYLDRVNASGGLAFVARSVDDVKRFLEME